MYDIRSRYAATRSNKSRSFGCKPSPREAASALNSSKDVISKPPVPVASQDQHELLVVGCHSESCSQIGMRELEAKKWGVLLRSWKRTSYPVIYGYTPWSGDAVIARSHRVSPPASPMTGSATKQSGMPSRWQSGLLRFARNDAENSTPSFRGDAQHRTMVRNCAPENLEIPGLVLTLHPGMTA